MKRLSNRESFGGWLNKDICLRFFWAIRSCKGTQLYVFYQTFYALVTDKVQSGVVNRVKQNLLVNIFSAAFNRIETLCYRKFTFEGY